MPAGMAPESRSRGHGGGQSSARWRTRRGTVPPRGRPLPACFRTAGQGTAAAAAASEAGSGLRDDLQPQPPPVRTVPDKRLSTVTTGTRLASPAITLVRRELDPVRVRLEQQVAGSQVGGHAATWGSSSVSVTRLARSGRAALISAMMVALTPRPISRIRVCGEDRSKTTTAGSSISVISRPNVPKCPTRRAAGSRAWRKASGGDSHRVGRRIHHVQGNRKPLTAGRARGQIRRSTWPPSPGWRPAPDRPPQRGPPP